MTDYENILQNERWHDAVGRRVLSVYDVHRMSASDQVRLRERYQSLEQIRRYDKWDETRHPRDEAGQFTTTEADRIPQDGDQFTLKMVRETGTDELGIVIIGDVDEDERIGITEQTIYDKGWTKPLTRIPVAALKHLLNDTQGRLDLDKPTGNAAIDTIAGGGGTFLGKGQDGVAWSVGNQVVKASTPIPFHPLSAQVTITPEQAADRLITQVERNNDLVKAGVPGLLPMGIERHEDKAFAIMDKLDTTAKLTPEQLDQVRTTVNAIHKAGYVVGDQIQVGIHPKDGRAYIYDTGQVREIDEHGHGVEDDNDHLKRLFKEHGSESTFLPVNSRATKELSTALSHGGLFLKWLKRGRTDITEEQISNAIRDMAQAAKAVDDAEESSMADEWRDKAVQLADELMKTSGFTTGPTQEAYLSLLGF